MCKSREEIRSEDVLVSEVDDYLLERLSDSNGDKHWDILFGKMLQKTYVNSEYNEGQITDIRGIVEDLAETVDTFCESTEKKRRENPTLSEQVKKKTAATVSTIVVLFGALFMFYYTLIVIVGYAELLQVFVP